MTTTKKSRLEELLSRSEAKTWTHNVSGVDETFRSLTEFEKHKLSSMRMKPTKSGDIEVETSIDKQRQCVLMSICHQWVDENGASVVDPADWESLGSLSEEVVSELTAGCRFDAAKEIEAEAEREAVKNSD